MVLNSLKVVIIAGIDNLGDVTKRRMSSAYKAILLLDILFLIQC